MASRSSTPQDPSDHHSTITTDPSWPEDRPLAEQPHIQELVEQRICTNHGAPVKSESNSDPNLGYDILNLKGYTDMSRQEIFAEGLDPEAGEGLEKMKERVRCSYWGHEHVYKLGRKGGKGGKICNGMLPEEFWTCNECEANFCPSCWRLNENIKGHPYPKRFGFSNLKTQMSIAKIARDLRRKRAEAGRPSPT